MANLCNDEFTQTGTLDVAAAFELVETVESSPRTTSTDDDLIFTLDKKDDDGHDGDDDKFEDGEEDEFGDDEELAEEFEELDEDDDDEDDEFDDEFGDDDDADLDDGEF